MDKPCLGMFKPYVKRVSELGSLNVFLIVGINANTSISVSITTDSVGSFVKYQGMMERVAAPNNHLSRVVMSRVPFLKESRVIKIAISAVTPTVQAPGPPPFWTCPKKIRVVIADQTIQVKI